MEDPINKSRPEVSVEGFLDAIAISLTTFGRIDIEDLLVDDRIERYTDLVRYIFNEGDPAVFVWADGYDYDRVEFSTSGDTKRGAKYTDVYLKMQHFPALVDFYKIDYRRSPSGAYNMCTFETLRNYSSGLSGIMGHICDSAAPDCRKCTNPYVNRGSQMKFWKLVFTNDTGPLEMTDVYRLHGSGSDEFNTEIVPAPEPAVGDTVYGLGMSFDVKLIKNETVSPPIVNVALVVSDVILVPDNMIGKLGFAKILLRKKK